MTLLHMIATDEEKQAIYSLDLIDMIEFPKVQFDDEKRKQPAIRIRFKGGSTSTFKSKNWIMQYE